MATQTLSLFVYLSKSGLELFVFQHTHVHSTTLFHHVAMCLVFLHFHPDSLLLTS